MKKVRRFADGGETQDMVAPGDEEAIKNRLIAGMPEEPDRVFAAPDRFSPPADKPPIVTKEQLEKSGLSLRDYMNKQQGLTRRGAPAADTSNAYGREQQYQRAQEAAQSSEEKAKRAAMEKSQALEGSYPEQALIGGTGFGIKSLAQVAKNLANRGGAKEVAKQVEPYLAKEAQKALPAPAKQLALPAPARQLGMGRGFKVMKKGGSTQGYASGGKVRSASSRADGIAIRGKTRA